MGTVPNKQKYLTGFLRILMRNSDGKNVKSHTTLEVSTCEPSYSRSCAGDFRRDQETENSASKEKGKPHNMLLTRNGMHPPTLAMSEDHARIAN